MGRLQEGERLRPPGSVSIDIAGAVARAARDAGVGRDLTDEQIEQELDHEIWNFDYPTLKPI
jgi:hypothetical protein